MSGSPKRSLFALSLVTVTAALAGLGLRSLVLSELSSAGQSLSVLSSIGLVAVPMVLAVAAFFVGSRRTDEVVQQNDQAAVSTIAGPGAASEEVKIAAAAVEDAAPAPAVEEVGVGEGSSAAALEPAAAPVLEQAAAELPEPEPEEEPEDGSIEETHVAGDENRLQKIISGLDELARAQALGQALHAEPIDLPLFLDAVVSKVGPLENRDISLSISCENGLTLAADQQCLTIVLTNLIDNAIKAVGRQGSITLRAAQKGDLIELVVDDTGKGIKKKDLPHIFERFYRASGNGIGLGLTIVDELVRACNGTITVSSKRGKGTSFVLTIPRGAL